MTGSSSRFSARSPKRGSYLRLSRYILYIACITLTGFAAWASNGARIPINYAFHRIRRTAQLSRSSNQSDTSSTSTIIKTSKLTFEADTQNLPKVRLLPQRTDPCDRATTNEAVSSGFLAGDLHVFQKSCVVCT